MKFLKGSLPGIVRETTVRDAFGSSIWPETKKIKSKHIFLKKGMLCKPKFELKPLEPRAQAHSMSDICGEYGLFVLFS